MWRVAIDVAILAILAVRARLPKNSRTACVRLVRRYTASEATESAETFDAVMKHVVELPQTQFVQWSSDGTCTIASLDPISVGDGMFVQHAPIDVSSSGDIVSSVVDIFSYTRTLADIQTFVARVKEDFKRQNHPEPETSPPVPIAAEPESTNDETTLDEAYGGGWKTVFGDDGAPSPAPTVGGSSLIDAYKETLIDRRDPPTASRATII